MTKPGDNSDLIGLLDAEVAERLALHGYNELPGSKKRSIFRILWEVVREPMFLLLIMCGLLYLVLGDIEEALMLLGFVFIIMGIELFQEQKTERALEALRDLSSPRALVIRNGVQQRIAGREVVCDDIVLISEGDRVPADGVLLSGTNLSVDESLLTGESIPVRKLPWDGVLQTSRPGGDDLPFVFSGTMAVKGQGIMRVIATAAATEIGKIGKALQTLEIEETNLQKQTGGIVKSFAFAGLLLCLVIVVIFGLNRGDWLQGLLAGITLAMAILPEEFPVVMTIFLALGAWRISQRKVLTRRVPAVEMLGAATVLCVDKTGTLTLNRMRVSRIAAGAEIFDVSSKPASIPEAFHEVVEYSILASPVDPFDPMETAMKELGNLTLTRTGHLHDDWELVREYPLAPELLAMSRVWQSPDGEDYVIAAKGAPEAVAVMCRMDDEQLAVFERHIENMAADGLRIIAVARAHFQKKNLPEKQTSFRFELVGLLGLADPIRPGVPEAVRECYDAGIRVIMITGDYPGTASNIAAQIGLQGVDQIITGPELDAMDDVELQQRIRSASIFARAVPEQKLRLVNALKANGEIVAMTGDGVNDAPALKAAHIGVAMGGRGTDVARESAALVLLDDNFASIVAAVRMGRRIFDNLKKAMTFIFSVHIPIAGLSLLPVLLGWPLVLLPVHIVFLELIIDPACSVVFEMERDEANIMRRKPRRITDPLFGRPMILTGLIQGLGVLVIVLTVYGVTFLRGYGENEARVLAFATLVIGNLGLIFSNRSQSRPILQTLQVPNAALWWVSGGAVLFLALSLALPFLRSLFRFEPIHPSDMGVVLLAGVAAILLSELVKLPVIQRLILGKKST